MLFLTNFSSKTAEISVDCLIENPENCIWRKSLLSGFCNFHFKMWHLIREENINSEFKIKLGFTYSFIHPLITLSLNIIYPKPQNTNIIPFWMVLWSFYDVTARLAYTEKRICNRNRFTVPGAGKAKGLADLVRVCLPVQRWELLVTLWKRLDGTLGENLFSEWH